MLTLILGAGASYDSAPQHSSEVAQHNVWRPPLTNDLFGADQIWFSEVPFPNELSNVLARIRRETPKNGLEITLEHLSNEMKDNPRRWGQILAIQVWISKVLNACASNWLPDLNGVTTYVDLLNRLGDWRKDKGNPINIITFNYDTLIDRAVSKYYSNKIVLNKFAHYITQDFNIFKPHGSTNWQLKFYHRGNRKSPWDWPLNDDERNDSSLLISENWKDIQTRNDDRGITYSLMPAIAIPVVNKSKSDFIFPPGHGKQMIDNLKSTTAILIMGWAAAEEHFLSLLNQYVPHNVPVSVVCRDGGEKATISLARIGGLNNWFDTKQGVSEFLDTNLLEDWLNNSHIA